MSKLQAPRGTTDILFNESEKFQKIIDTARNLSKSYGASEIHTPIFEHSGVFKRTLGENSDIVHKEMYSFNDRSDNELTLRPEGTAPIVRAVLSNSLTQSLPLKLFYAGPMFRYERPQKGRQRQFHQWGFEVFGVQNPNIDIELLSFAWTYFEKLGLKDKISLEINSIGDKESRDSYKAALVDFYNLHKESLSEDSLRRLTQNPLRILDSKDKGDKEINKGAPDIDDYLNDTSRGYYDKITNGLDALGLAYTKNSRLVRGLDYYNHVVFEFKAEGLGSQDAVLSGGRYDGLVKTMGGPEMASVGFAAGVERLGLLLGESEQTTKPIVFISLDEKCDNYTLSILNKLRADGIACELTYSGNLSKRMKRAAKLGADYAIIIGEDEMAKNEVCIKTLSTGEQAHCGADKIKATIK